MLEQFLQKTRGIMLAVIVILLSGVFVLQFGGPQAQGCSGSQNTLTAAEVNGQSISKADLRAAFVLVGGDRYPAEMAKQNRLQEMVLEGLIEEALLADEARDLGFSITEDEVMEQVIEEGLVHVAMSVDAGPYLPPAGPRRYDFKDKDGAFSKDNLKRFIQGGLQRSVRDFTESQIKATLAQRMREVVMASVEVGPSEVWDAFVREREKATLSYVRFSPSYFQSQLKPSDEELQKFMSDAQEEIDKSYEKQKHRYTGLEKQVRARHILIKVDSSAADEEKAAAKARATELLQRAKDGEDFATLAREHSEDTGSGKRGGDLGYNPKGRMVAPFDEAQFSMEPGQISDEPVESTFGYHVIKVEAIREGDVPVDEAKREIAEQLYREQRGKALAEDAAKRALAAMKGGTEGEALEKQLAGPASEGEQADPLAPKVMETRAFGRGDSPIAGAFDGSALTSAAFELTMEHPLPDAPLQLGDEFIVFKLTDRTEATREDFSSEEKDRLRAELLSNRRAMALANHVRQLKEQALAAGRVSSVATLTDEG